ncbi:MAG: F0F1 ATP synthase subunit A, partial [Dehalococcoidia bacterium]
MIVAELLPSLNEIFDWRDIFNEHTALAFNKTALMAFVSTAICIAIFGLGARKRALVPAGIQNVAEMGYLAIEENVSLQTVGGEEAKKWTPFFATLFFWIFFINIWSIIPG